MNGNIEAAFIGRVGNDLELKTSQAGKPWTSLNVAVGRDDDVQWVKVVAFGDCAQKLAGTLHKGDRVYVEGRLSLDTWTGKDSQERSGLKVAGWRIDRLGEIGRNKPAQPRTDAGDGASTAAAAKRDWQRPADDGDPIPF